MAAVRLGPKRLFSQAGELVEFDLDVTIWRDGGAPSASNLARCGVKSTDHIICGIVAGGSDLSEVLYDCLNLESSDALVNMRACWGLFRASGGTTGAGLWLRWYRLPSAFPVSVLGVCTLPVPAGFEGLQIEVLSYRFNGRDGGETTLCVTFNNPVEFSGWFHHQHVNPDVEPGDGFDSQLDAFFVEGTLTVLPRPGRKSRLLVNIRPDNSRSKPVLRVTYSPRAALLQLEVDFKAVTANGVEYTRECQPQPEYKVV